MQEVQLNEAHLVFGVSWLHIINTKPLILFAQQVFYNRTTLILHFQKVYVQGSILTSIFSRTCQFSSQDNLLPEERKHIVTGH